MHMGHVLLGFHSSGPSTDLHSCCYVSVLTLVSTEKIISERLSDKKAEKWFFLLLSFCLEREISVQTGEME